MTTLGEFEPPCRPWDTDAEYGDAWWNPSEDWLLEERRRRCADADPGAAMLLISTWVRVWPLLLVLLVLELIGALCWYASVLERVRIMRGCAG